MNWLDSLAEASVRSMAQRTSRRSLLASLGALLVGTAALPLLPVARGAEPPQKGAAPNGGADDKAAAKAAALQDPQSCEYWRHCGSCSAAALAAALSSAPPFGAAPF